MPRNLFFKTITISLFISTICLTFITGLQQVKLKLVTEAAEIPQHDDPILEEVVVKDGGENSSEWMMMMRCPNLHTIRDWDGLNIFKQKLIGYMAQVSCSASPIVLLPPLFSHSSWLNSILGDQKLLSFDQVFDMKALNSVFLEKKLVAEAIPALDYTPTKEAMSSFITGEGSTSACRKDKPVESNVICPNSVAETRDGDALDSFRTIAGQERLYGLLTAMKPAKKLMHVVNAFIDEIGSTTYLCIHLRTEKDFQEFSVSMNYALYKNENYFKKLAWHMKSEALVYENITKVFIAGDHNQEEFKNSIEPLFKELFPSNASIFGHDSVMNNSSGYANIQRAGIDQEICAQATVFIGTSKSGWSELTHYTRYGMLRSKNGNVTYGDMLDFMVDHPDDSHLAITEKLVKFKGANHEKFFTSHDDRL